MTLWPKSPCTKPAGVGRSSGSAPAACTILQMGVRVSVDADRIAKLPEVVEAALAQKGLIAGMRSLAGE